MSPASSCLRIFFHVGVLIQNECGDVYRGICASKLGVAILDVCGATFFRFSPYLSHEVVQPMSAFAPLDIVVHRGRLLSLRPPLASASARNGRSPSNNSPKKTPDWPTKSGSLRAMPYNPPAHEPRPRQPLLLPMLWLPPPLPSPSGRPR